MRSFLFPLFSFHDELSGFFARNITVLKRGILVIATLSFFGIFFPEVYKGYGEIAGNLLIVILFLSPISKILRMRILLQWMGFRRELGILMGYLALVHGVGFMIEYEILSVFSFPENPGLFDFFFPFGFAGLLLLLPLLLTSNTLSVKFFGPYWKKIHMLVYPAFLFIVLHRMLAGSEGGSLEKMLEAGFLLVSYTFLKLFSWRPFFPPASRFFSFVADEYRVYQKERAS